MEFNRNLPALEHTDFEIIGTKMHVAIFVYSDFASLSLKFSMSKTNCNILLASKMYISYSGYITPVDDTTHVFHMNQPSKGFLEYDDCFQFQYLAFLYEIAFNFLRIHKYWWQLMALNLIAKIITHVKQTLKHWLVNIMLKTRMANI